jgi:hypothetical protein
MPYLQSVDNPGQAGATYQYSRNLLPGCWNEDPQGRPCSIAADSESQIDYQLHINDLLLNETSAITNLYVDPTERFVYLGPPTIDETTTTAAIGPLEYPHFNASTFAMTTTCAPAACDLSADTSQTIFSFSCSEGFSRNSTDSWFEAGPWIQSPGDNYTGYTGLWNKYNIDTGLQWGVFAHLDNYRLPNGTSFNHSLTSGKPSVTLVMECNSRIGPTAYSWANNTLLGPLSPDIANQTLFNITLGPFLSQGRILPFPNLQMLQDRLDVKDNDTTGAVLAKFQTLISGIGLSFLGANIDTGPAINLQLPGSTIVTQVPKLPLFTLVALNLWYAGLAICLYILACLLLSRGDQADDIKAVRELLSVGGLTRAAVSNHRSIQGEDVRIGVIKRDGQWHFQVWPASNNDKGEGEGLLQPDVDTGAASTTAGSGLSDGMDESSRLSIFTTRSTTTNSAYFRGDEEPGSHEEPSVSPMSPASYTNALFSEDHEDRRRISRGLEWADGKR